MAQYYKKPKQDPLEVKIVLGILRGLVWLIAWPLRGLGRKNDAPRKRAGTLDTQEVARRWGDIQTSIGLGGVTHFGSTVVAADKLLDYVLRQKGYSGETLGERLKNARDDISGTVYQRTWEAHKLRNQLVHEVDTEVLSFQAKEAIESFEQALRELGALR